MSAAYHQQIDGQFEVVNRCLETYLQCMTTTPYEVVYGQHAPIHRPYLTGDSKVDEVDRSLQQQFVLHKHSFKLYVRYYGPYKVLKKIGPIVYKLDLPTGAKAHPIFSVFKLKKYNGRVPTQTNLSLMDADGILAKEPIAILDKRLNKKKG
ncbi:uncharacterized protein LOC111308092 [Durio zibethinus]|uniref:Uncharacterized protein LOC111308092 n=1 Tax=Durio zibethinus TaxID=66656 RepID=A0A6P6AB83_DURZI|nr:uncharacterized protein LOC111308092 [Durio zibethinus]